MTIRRVAGMLCAPRTRPPLGGANTPPRGLGAERAKNTRFGAKKGPLGFWETQAHSLHFSYLQPIQEMNTIHISCIN